MPTKEQALSVDKDGRTSRGQNLDQAGKPIKFVFDAALSTAVAANGHRPATALEPKGPLTPEMLDKMNRYWRAANYLCIGQIYLFENPLLREPLKAEQIKPRLLGHWGTSPGQNLIYIHLNRLIKEHDANIIYIAGPGHGGPRSTPVPIWKAPIPKFIRRSHRTRTACGFFSGSSRRRAACPAIVGHTFRIPCTRAGNLDTLWSMLLAPLSTIQI
jgi:hypothetical protein